MIRYLKKEDIDMGAWSYDNVEISGAKNCGQRLEWKR